MTGKDTKFIIFAPPIELMMKYNAIALIVALLSTAACNDRNNDDMLVRYGLTVPVKTLSLIPDTSLFITPYDFQTMNFRADGKIINRLFYNPDGSPFNYETYEYDDKGRVISYNFYSLEGTYEGGYTYEYDGKVIRKCVAHSPEFEETASWVNKNDGRHITESVFRSEGEVEYTSINKWNRKGTLRDEQTVDADGEPIGTAHYEYIAEEMPTLIQSEDLEITIEYNEKLLPIRSEGVALSAVSDLEWIEPEENPVTYEYEYDYAGNWIIRAEFRGSPATLTRLIRREIEY